MLRSYQPADAEVVLNLNAANQPEVGPMDATKLAQFELWAPYLKVIEVESEIVALLIGLDQNCPYESPNYRWFTKRYQRFAYIDRIAIAESERGKGWGPLLYDDFSNWAKGDGHNMICAEVNVQPPNPRSLRFHQIYGFEQIEEFQPYGESDGEPEYKVVMLSKNI